MSGTIAFIAACTALVIGILCLCEIQQLKKGAKDTQKMQKTYAETLKSLKGKECEIVVEDALVYIDILYNIKGQVLDADDEWVLISGKKGKKTVQRMFRISLISDVKEIRGD